MEHSFTDTVLALIGNLDYIDTIGLVGSLDREFWGYAGGDTWQELADNLPALIDYLKSEYHQGHKIDPQIECLRESLQAVVATTGNACQDKSKTIYRDFVSIKYLCADWVKWIDRYFPVDPDSQQQPRQDTAPAAPAGRPSHKGKTVKGCMLLQDDEQKNELLKKLHELIDGNKGRRVALVILVCEAMGLMNNPGYAVMMKEFGYIGARSGYNRFHDMGIKNYKKEEADGIMVHLAGFRDSLK